jgi:hypothetical protein
MAIRSINVVINNDTWTFTTYSATKGLVISNKLLSIFGPSLSTIFDGKEAIDLSKAVSILVENMDKADVVALVTSMLSDVRKNGHEISFDNEFAGNYGVMLELLYNIIKENFKSFFSVNGLDSLLSRLKATQVQ